MRNHLQNPRFCLLAFYLIVLSIPKTYGITNREWSGTRHEISAAPIITQEPSSQAICANSDATFSIVAIGATSYQWQVNTGTGFTDLAELPPYSNVNTPNLKITNVPSAYQDFVYRCIASNSGETTTSSEANIAIKSTWTGAVDSNWDNAANWSCNAVPDINTDVEILYLYQRSPIVTANSAARNVQITSGSLTVSSGGTFMLAGKIIGYGYNATAPNALTVFSANGPQEIRSGTYANIRIVGGNKTMEQYGSDITVLENFDFASGKFLLGLSSLYMGPSATVSNFDKDRYFVVNYSMGGGLVMYTDQAGQIFPIGTATSYTPMTVVHDGDPYPVKCLVLDGAYEHFNGGDAQGMPIANGVVNKSWFAFEGTGGIEHGKISLTLQWNSTDEKPGFNREICGLATIIGNSIGSRWQCDELKAASGSGPYTLSRSNVEMGRFAVADDEVLPVRLVKFEANQEEKAISLKWLTADAVNVSHFEVERSLNGRVFTKILEEQYLEGKHAYRIVDTAFVQGLPAGGSIYYRLKMVDKDASFTYSRIINIKTDSQQPTAFGSPNPFSNRVMVQVPWALSQSSTVNLSNSSGQSIFIRRVTFVENEVNIEVDQSLPTGQYILTIQDQDQIKSVKLVKH
ncbi:T9SS type A sorting domain-containing protein [Dyadobacter alkalitolerans]|uniref:T9SS type A sorting domain-containing protein n=1 Tax=Dyadobacter alkalitolerans TaxID=492736 RepID=UPI0003FC2B87|nr:T9SS type A sorting domain-containing protein [Dyadobacter alkalitolerans]